MKANLEIVLEIDGRRFELTPEEAAELARKLQALGHGIQPAPAPIPWPGPYTYPEPVYPHWQGNGTGDPMPPNVKIWCGSAGCPPRPEALIHGVVTLYEKVKAVKFKDAVKA